MKDDYEIRFIHTESCSVCRGTHNEYRSRQWCKGCQSLISVLISRGLLVQPRANKKPANAINITAKIFSLRAKGLSLKQIAEATGLAVNTISSRIYKAHKEAGTLKHKKRGDEV